jgi:hypothetical protein
VCVYVCVGGGGEGGGGRAKLSERAACATSSGAIAILPSRTMVPGQCCVTCSVAPFNPYDMHQPSYPVHPCILLSTLQPLTTHAPTPLHPAINLLNS